MTDEQTMPDWVLVEAAKRSGYSVETISLLYKSGGAIGALCDMIERYEQPPVDRKLLCAREAMREQRPDDWPETACLRAIELWEEGFGK